MTKIKKPPFWATLFTLFGIAILCSLGTWQLQRLEWKTDILSKLDAAYESDNSQTLAIDEFKPGGFAYGRVQGIFLADKALLLGPKTRNKEIGNDLIVPLQMPGRTLLVNMGWTQWKLENLPIYHLNSKQVWFEGLARTPGWNSFTPENNPQENLWYKPDIAEIAAAKNLTNPLPFMLYAERASHKFDAAFPNNQRWHPNNNHLQYALFWFSMAGALIIVYVLRFVCIKSEQK